MEKSPQGTGIRRKAQQKSHLAVERPIELLERLDVIARQLSGMMYQYQKWPDGRSSFPIASGRLLERFGFSLGEIKEDAGPAIRCVHSEDTLLLEDAFRTSELNLSDLNFELRISSKTGELIWIEGQGIPERRADGSTLWSGYIQEISERKRVEEALRRSEEKFRNFVEIANDVIYTLDLDGNLQYVSPGWNLILGDLPGGLIGKGIDSFLHPEDLPSCRAFIDKAIISRSKQEGAEYRVRHADGSWRWHTSNVAPLLGQDGALIGLLGIGRDISDRKSAEDRLRISELRYRLIADYAHDVIWTMEFDGSISYVSPSVEMVRGFTVQEAIRQPLTEILAPDSQRVMLHYFSQLTTNVQAGIHPKDFRGDLEYRCKDGSTVWTEVIAFPLLDSDGGFVQLVGVTRDISERKRTEAVLREQKARLDFALTASGLGFWDWDIPSGHVLFGNRVLAMLSYAPEEIVSDAIGWEQLVHHDDKAAVLELRQNHLDGDSVMFEAEYRLRHKDGHWVWILDRGKVIAREADGKPLRMTGTYEDISHRKHLESESTNLLSQIQRLMHEAIRPNYLGNDASPVKEKKTDQLTRRQREITCLVASGLTSVDIAKRLNIATETVEAHRRDVMRKLDLHSVAALTRLAIQERLLSDE